MTSIYQRVLGSDFNRLHPQIQRRFGFSSVDGVAAIGRGVMDEIWNGRFYEGPIGFTFPTLFSGVADVREWYDDKTQGFRIVVDVRNRTWGRLFGYRGRFDVEWRTVTAADVPTHLFPRRYERRE